MAGQMRATPHFDRSFFESSMELGLHLPGREPKESLFPPHYFAIQNGSLHRLKGGQGVSPVGDTDLRKIRDFVFAHLEEIGQVPMSERDNSVMRIYNRLLAIDLLIAKHNSSVSKTAGSSPIEPLMMKQIERLQAILDAVGIFLKEKNLSERLSVQQEVVRFARTLDPRVLIPVYSHYPGLQGVIDAEFAKQPLPEETLQIQALAKTKNFLAFYRSGPTASLSMLAECPNGIQIYGKKFPCIASAFEYKRCQEGGCSQESLELFPILKGDAPIAYGAMLMKGKSNWNWTNELMTFPSLQWKVMDEIVQAKYAQNRGMLNDLLATGNTTLVFHPPEGEIEQFWSDGHKGSGRNEFGAILERVRAIACGKPAPEPLRTRSLGLESIEYLAYFNKSLDYAIF